MSLRLFTAVGRSAKKQKEIAHAHLTAIALQAFLPCFLCTVKVRFKCPVQESR